MQKDKHTSVQNENQDANGRSETR